MGRMECITVLGDVKMANLRCKICGGELEVFDENNIVCGKCGEKYALSLVEDVSKIKERVNIFLGNREWDKADEYAELILDKYPHSSFAYRTKLMAKYGLRNDESFLDMYETRFLRDVNYKMMNLSNPEEADEWLKTLAKIKENHQMRKQEDCFDYLDFPINSSQAYGFLWTDYSGFDDNKQRAIDDGQYKIAYRMENECFVLKQPFVGIFKKSDIDITDVLVMLEKCVKSQREYLIVLSSYGESSCNIEFLPTLAFNCLKGVLKGIVVVTTSENVDEIYKALKLEENNPYKEVDSVYVNCDTCSVSIGRKS